MNSNESTVISLPMLIEALSELTGTDNDTAARFTREFFALIEENLVKGRNVRIKGIGSFAVTDRDSGMVLFTPDNELAEAVNTPFAMFEPMEIDSAELLEELGDTPVQQPEPDESESAEAEDVAGEIAATPKSTDEGQSDYVLNIDSNDETDVEYEPEDEPVLTPDVAPELVVEPIKDTADEPQSTPDCETETEPAAAGGKLWRYTAVAAVALAIGFGAGYLSYPHINAKPEQPDSTLTHIDIESNQNPAADTLLSDTVAETENVADEIIPAEILDTIRRDNYLATMARRHYDQMEYWVFIYEANEGLGHPDRIKPGTVVKVPAKSSFVLESDSATMARAHRLHTEIYSRF